MPSWLEFLIELYGSIIRLDLAGSGVYGTIMFWIGVYAVAHLGFSVMDDVL